MKKIMIAAMTMSCLLMTDPWSYAQQPQITVRDASGQEIPIRVDVQTGEQKQSSDTTDPNEIPRMVIEQVVYEAGEVWQGETVSHDFAIKNEGKGTLKIFKAKPG